MRFSVYELNIDEQYVFFRTARFNAACTAAELSEIGKKYFGLKSGAGGKNTKRKQ